MKQKRLSDNTIRAHLIALGHITPETDKEIQEAIQPAKTIRIPAHLDNVRKYSHPGQQEGRNERSGTTSGQ